MNRKLLQFIVKICYNGKDIKTIKRKDVNKNGKQSKENKINNNSKCFLNRCFIFIDMINKGLAFLIFFIF